LRAKLIRNAPEDPNPLSGCRIAVHAACLPPRASGRRASTARRTNPRALRAPPARSNGHEDRPRAPPGDSCASDRVQALPPATAPHRILELISQMPRSTESASAPVPPRREEGEYALYLTDEQRRGTGCPGGRMPRDL